MTRGENNHAVLLLRYDSLGPVRSEDQKVNTGADRLAKTDPMPSYVEKTVASSHDGNRNRVKLDYPVTTGPTIVFSYDAIDRVKLVREGFSVILADYQYAGRGPRILEKRLPQAGVTLYRGYDGDRRVTSHSQRMTEGQTTVAGFSYAWDRVGNRWYEEDASSGAGSVFGYDSAYRMTEDYENVSAATIEQVATNAPRRTATPTFSSSSRLAKTDSMPSYVMGLRRSTRRRSQLGRPGRSRLR